MMVALYPGSFDPATLGHYNIIEQAACIFGKVHVGVGNNPNKRPLFSSAERVGFLKARFADDERIQVGAYDGLTVEYAQRLKGIDCLVRGLRNPDDLKYEHHIARINYCLTGLRTVFLLPDDSYILVSSEFVRQVAVLGKDPRTQLARLVDTPVIEAIIEKMRKQKLETIGVTIL